MSHLKPERSARRAAVTGIDDGDDAVIAEVVAHVALDVFTNYFNNVARTDLDFPRAPELTPEPVQV